MVDVSGKEDMHRIARAAGHIRLSPATLKLIRDNDIKKGDVLTLAKVAGIQAAKKTGELIPLCHPLMLSFINVEASIEKDGVRVVSEVRCTGQTGVEMEALTAVSTALLTVYDMCKAVDKGMEIGSISLLEKTKTGI